MCQFNFLVTKEKSNNSEIKEIASEYGLNYAEYKLGFPNFAEFRAFLTTTKHCDCGSVLGKNIRKIYLNLTGKKRKNSKESDSQNAELNCFLNRNEQITTR